MKRSRADLPAEDVLRGLLDEKGRISVRVIPGARSEGLAIDAGRLTAKVRTKPQGGEANDAVRRLLAIAYGVPPSQIEMIRGAASREKLFEIGS